MVEVKSKWNWRWSQDWKHKMLIEAKPQILFSLSVKTKCHRLSAIDHVPISQYKQKTWHDSYRLCSYSLVWYVSFRKAVFHFGDIPCQVYLENHLMIPIFGFMPYMIEPMSIISVSGHDRDAGFMLYIKRISGKGKMIYK